MTQPKDELKLSPFEAYTLAKRQVVAEINRRLMCEKPSACTFESLRSYIRNVMLWKEPISATQNMADKSTLHKDSDSAQESYTDVAEDTPKGIIPTPHDTSEGVLKTCELCGTPVRVVGKTTQFYECVLESPENFALRFKNAQEEIQDLQKILSAKDREIERLSSLDYAKEDERRKDALSLAQSELSASRALVGKMFEIMNDLKYDLPSIYKARLGRYLDEMKALEETK